MDIQKYKRNEAIDFTKGFLVIGMVAYHTLNYFLNGRSVMYVYVNYVTTAFIFYSGLLCGTIYLKKYLNDPLYVSKRLLIRSFKLLILFIVVNIAMHIVLNESNYGEDLGVNVLLYNLYSIFIIGNPQLMAFEILLPIAYVIIICALLLYLFKLRFIILCFLILSFFLIHYKGIKLGYNPSSILVGIGGFYTGLVCSEIYSNIKRTINNIVIIPLTLLFFLVVVPIGAKLQFVTGAKLDFFPNYIITNLVVASLYTLGNWLNSSKILTKHIILFGQFSLYLYLVQIFILQILSSVLKINNQLINMGHLCVFVFVNLCLVFFCYFAEFSRKRFRIIDYAYRLIF